MILRESTPNTSALLVCFRDVWQNGQMAGTFDGRRQLALMAGAASGDSARNNLAPFGDKPAQQSLIPVIDGDDMIFAEAAMSFFSPVHTLPNLSL